MRIKHRQVIVNHIDDISEYSYDWETRERGKIPGGPAHHWDTPAWREHMGKVFALRAKKLAPQCDAKEFYRRMSMLSKELGFAEDSVLVRLTEDVYGVYMSWPKG